MAARPARAWRSISEGGIQLERRKQILIRGRGLAVLQVEQAQPQVRLGQVAAVGILRDVATQAGGGVVRGQAGGVRECRRCRTRRGGVDRAIRDALRAAGHSEEHREPHACDEPADVRAVRDPASRAVAEQERQQVVDEQEEAQHPARGKLHHVHEEREQEHEDLHDVAGEPDEVAAEHAGNRSRRADDRHRGVCREDRVGPRRERAGHKVGREIAEAAQTMLDVVAEDPQKQHVPAQMRQTRMQEQGKEQGLQAGGDGPVAVGEDEDVVGRKAEYSSCSVPLPACCRTRRYSRVAGSWGLACCEDSGQLMNR